jgi:hypothetical protein
MEVTGQLHDPASLPCEKIARYLLTKRVDSSLRRSGGFGEVKKSHAQSRIELQIFHLIA